MKRWTAERANEWYARQPWLLGANYVPSTAANDVEMWMKDTFDPETIRRELGYARDIGMNTVRVFLSYTVWKEEGQIFLDHFEEFLQIAADTGISVTPILFDDCAFDEGKDPFYGPQQDPEPGVANGRWVASPGYSVADDPTQTASCKAYVDAVISAYKDDERILMWDLYNEPGNRVGAQQDTELRLPSLPLLVNVFQWARAHEPSQPLSAGVWTPGWPGWEGFNQIIFELSDIVNMHSYSALDYTKRIIEMAQAQNRPIVMTEWLCRTVNCSVQTHLPYFKEQNVGSYLWSLVRGRTQTWINGTIWKDGAVMGAKKREEAEAQMVWHQDLLYEDGSPFDPAETELMKALTK